MKVGQKLHRGSTTIGIVELRTVVKDGKDVEEARVMYLEKPDLEINEWYPVSLLRKLWSTR